MVVYVTFLRDVACQKLLNSANVSRSYSQNNTGTVFWDTVDVTDHLRFRQPDIRIAATPIIIRTQNTDTAVATIGCHYQPGCCWRCHWPRSVYTSGQQHTKYTDKYPYTQYCDCRTGKMNVVAQFLQIHIHKKIKFKVSYLVIISQSYCYTVSSAFFIYFLIPSWSNHRPMPVWCRYLSSCQNVFLSTKQFLYKY